MKVLPLDIMYRLRGRLERLYGKKSGSQLLERLTLLAGRYAVEDLREPSPKGGPHWNEQDTLLITYGDMVCAPEEKPLKTLGRFLDQRLKGAISNVHILPFFPYSSDEGFSVIDYLEVDDRLGSWEDVQAIGKELGLMFDLVLNHTSRQSSWFTNFVNGIAPARDYFIIIDPETDLKAVVRPRTSPLLSPTQTAVGERCVWTTFSTDQIDLNFANPDVLFEFLDILLDYVKRGARIIRLDAIAYLWKRSGTSCLNLPETHEIVKLLRDVLAMLAPQVILLTETNLPHEQNLSYFGEGDEAHMVYQFSLPPLLLHALHTGSGQYLNEWANSLPPIPAGCTYLNFTASHDGIGVRPLEGLVPETEIERLIATVEERGGYVSKRTDGTSGAEKPYEFNITYFDALSDFGHSITDRHIARFLCSQAIMLGLKGIPATYFHSLTATRNDYRGVDRTGQARSINRKRWQELELNTLLEDPASHTARVFHDYVRLLKLRASQPAFHPDGDQKVLALEEGLFGFTRTAPDGSELIAAISNMTPASRTLEIPQIVTATENNIEKKHLRELITSQNIDSGSLKLDPYATVWLTNAAPS